MSIKETTKLDMIDMKNRIINEKIGVEARRHMMTSNVKTIRPNDQDAIDEYNIQNPDQLNFPGRAPDLEEYHQPERVRTALELERNDVMKQVIANEIALKEDRITQGFEFIKLIEGEINKLPKQNFHTGIDPIISRKKREFRQMLTEIDDNIKKIRREIADLKTQMQMVELDERENGKRIMINEGEKSRVVNSNKGKIKAYQEEVNLLNSGKFNIDQYPHESEEQYLDRLQETIGADTSEEQRDRATQFVRKEFRKNMKEIIKEDAVINEIANRLDGYDDVSNQLFINIDWPEIKRKYIKKFGINNKFIGYTVVIDFFNDIKNEAENVKIVTGIRELDLKKKIEADFPDDILDNDYFPEHEETTSRSHFPKRREPSYFPEPEPEPFDMEAVRSRLLEKSIKPKIKEEREMEYAPFDVEEAKSSKAIKPEKEEMGSNRKVHTNELGIKTRLTDDHKTFIATKNDTSIYFKVLRDDHDKLLISHTGAQGTYGELYKEDAVGHIRVSAKIDELVKHSIFTEDEIKSIFGTTQRVIICARMLSNAVFAAKYGANIIPLQIDEINRQEVIRGKSKTRTTRIGYGIQHEDVPDKASFGDVVLLLHKLVFSNTLAVKRHNLTNITGFPNIKVSDKFVRIITQIIQNGDPTNDIKELSPQEKQILDQLLHLAKLRKIHNTKDATIIALKNQYELISGEIQAGNDNPKLLRDAKQILTKMYNFGLIGQNDIITQYHSLANLN